MCSPVALLPGVPAVEPALDPRTVPVGNPFGVDALRGWVLGNEDFSV